MQGLFASLLASLSALVGLMLADRAMATEAAASAAVALAAPASPISADYLIGPGDTLEIFVWRNPDLTITVPVRPDGKISTPLVGAGAASPSLPYRDDMTVLDAVLAVGGLGQFAAGNRAHVVRNENGKQLEIKVKLAT
jgi:polysaccharide export outer membrane protein